jgi:hypothetical protein
MKIVLRMWCRQEMKETAGEEIRRIKSREQSGE